MTRIRRVSRPADNFTIVSNDFIRDSRLSLDAIGLGVWLLSHTIGWETNVKTITQRVKAGRDKVNRILDELTQYGYLRCIQERTSEGRMGVMSYEVQDVPFEDEPPGQGRFLKSRNRLSRNRSISTYKKTTPKETTPDEEQLPSGGTTPDGAVPSLEAQSSHQEEEPVVQPVDNLALFDAPPKAA